jgi:hypothetical protein
MLSRTYHSSVVGRSAAMRRQRRRTSGTGRLFCTTNGCPSFMTIDTDRQLAHCEICGATRRLD